MFTPTDGRGIELLRPDQGPINEEHRVRGKSGRAEENDLERKTIDKLNV